MGKMLVGDRRIDTSVTSLPSPAKRNTRSRTFFKGGSVPSNTLLEYFSTARKLTFTMPRSCSRDETRRRTCKDDNTYLSNEHKSSNNGSFRLQSNDSNLNGSIFWYCFPRPQCLHGRVDTRTVLLHNTQTVSQGKSNASAVNSGGLTPHMQLGKKLSAAYLNMNRKVSGSGKSGLTSNEPSYMPIPNTVEEQAARMY